MTLADKKPAMPALNFNAPVFSPGSGSGSGVKNSESSSTQETGTKQYTSDQGQKGEQEKGGVIKSKLNPKASSFDKKSLNPKASSFGNKSLNPKASSFSNESPLAVVEKTTIFDKLASTIAVPSNAAGTANAERQLNQQAANYATGYKQYSQNNGAVKSRAARPANNNNNNSNDTTIVSINTNTKNKKNDSNTPINNNNSNQNDSNKQKQQQVSKQQQQQVQRKGGNRDKSSSSNELEAGQVLEIPAQTRRGEKGKGATKNSTKKKQTQKYKQKDISNTTTNNSNKENQKIDKNSDNKNGEVDQNKSKKHQQQQKLATQTSVSAIDADMLQHVFNGIDSTVDKTRKISQVKNTPQVQHAKKSQEDELSEKVDSSNSNYIPKKYNLSNDQETSKKLKDAVAVRLDDDSSVGGRSSTRKTRRGTRAGRRVKKNSSQTSLDGEKNNNQKISVVTQAEVENYQRQVEQLKKEKANAEDMADQMMNQMYNMMQEKQSIQNGYAKLEREHNNVLEQLFYLEHLLHTMDAQNNQRDGLILEMFQLQKLIDIQLSQRLNIIPQSTSAQNLQESQQESTNVGVTESSMASYEYDYYHDHYDDEDDEDDGDMAYITQRQSMDPTKGIEPQSFSDYEGDVGHQGVSDTIEEGTCEGSDY